MKKLLLAIAMTFVAVSASATPGRLNSYGCHNSSTQGYHCHNSTSTAPTIKPPRINYNVDEHATTLMCTDRESGTNVRVDTDANNVKFHRGAFWVVFIPWQGENKEGTSADIVNGNLIISNQEKNQHMTINNVNDSPGSYIDFSLTGRNAQGKILDMQGPCSKTVWN
jgi:hypothetical protein